MIREITNSTARQTDTHTQTDHATPCAAIARILCSACDAA